MNGARPRTVRTGSVLLVDDRPEKLMIMETALAPLGREIVKAGSGRDALRWLLRRDFAVILLDLNMPGISGFETARLIRTRRRNRHTPIIFATAYGDDIQIIQGYSLGAVDFILSPCPPELLRSKVSVFLELYERTAEIREQAERWLRRTQQLQQLTRAALEIHAAFSIEQALQIVADSAQAILGVHQAFAIVAAEQIGLRWPRLAISPVQWIPGDVEPSREADLRQAVRQLSQTMRVSAAELSATVLGGFLRREGAEMPARGLSAPLLGRDGSVMGVLVAAGKLEGEFNGDDEALLVQLAQMAATAVENTLFAEARESNRIKDEFLATLSHELRTPLSSILGWTQLLRSQMLDPDETVEALEIIEQNAVMQSKLIEDLLDVSRIVTGKMQLAVRPISLAGVINAAVNVVLPAAQAKRVAIDVVLDDISETVNGDADRLQQVLWNLLSNAVKFTPPEGHIEMRLETDGPQARITIKDDGEGIAPEFLPHVFDRFRQADSSTSRRHGGLGIGLAIVRHVVELHGGTVRAESAGMGLGTTFVVMLPLARADRNSPVAPQPCATVAPIDELQEINC